MADEEHASLAEVLSWIRDSPIDPRISDYRSSRALKKSSSLDAVKTLMMRVVPPIRRLRPMLGTVVVPKVTVLVPDIKILPAKLLSGY